MSDKCYPWSQSLERLLGDALKTADDTLLFKQIIRDVAKRRGYVASFMAKPYPTHAGSGPPGHFSIVDAHGRNVFDDGTVFAVVLSTAGKNALRSMRADRDCSSFQR